MIRNLLVMSVMALGSGACGGSSDSPNPGSGGSGNVGGANNAGSCPDVSGEWTITDHCEASFIGMNLTVTENACALSFASPFDAFSGTVTNAGKITLSGPQSCTGTATSTSVSMNCTADSDACPVKLAR
jgi:hypothetical protein